MAFPSPSPTSCAILMSQILLLLVSLSNAFLADHPDASGMVDCGPRLLRLAPCLPFVQGALPIPPQPCCDNLLDIFNELPSCLCTLLNSSTIITFPINRTLALQLPALCNLSMNSSSCPGTKDRFRFLVRHHFLVQPHFMVQKGIMRMHLLKLLLQLLQWLQRLIWG
ncbi:hypothetical protein Scep_022534 [Stephania cephalantha]|uniref:Bifunctional inhibitor/plant lipid transfer protein/seed storage helical domain-containing protein n=1 Tax=Stephania cephalantha TaxID=152367 RepID=A0AAP0I2C0_9MAGN